MAKADEKDTAAAEQQNDGIVNNGDTEAREGAPTDLSTDQAFSASGPRSTDREYVDVPDEDKPHPSTIMQQEVLPSDKG